MRSLRSIQKALVFTTVSAFPIGAGFASSVTAGSLVTLDTSLVSAFKSGANVLGFDELPGNSGGAYPGTPVQPASQVTDHYRNLGVLFSSAGGPIAVIDGNCCPGDARSVPNLIGGTVLSGPTIVLNYFAPIKLQFVQPGTSTPSTTTRVGAWNDPTGSRIRLSVFDQNDVLLESVDADQRYFLGIQRLGIASATFTFLAQQSIPGFSLDDVTFDPLATTDVPAAPAAGTLWMDDPRPNPSSGQATTFSFRLPDEGIVDLAIYGIDGRLVARRAPERFGAGSHLLNWQPPALASGVYFARVSSSWGVSATRRWVVLR